MRKKIGTGKRTAVAILAAAMIMSGMGVPESCQSYPYAVSAAENEEQPEVDTHTLTDADADSESKQAESEQTDSSKDNKKIDDKEDSKENNKGKDKEAVDVSEFEQADPYEMSSFADMLNSDQLYFTNEKADVKAEEDGVHIAGKNKNIQGQKLMNKPKVEAVENLRPALNISQNYYNVNPRSTVGTTTEISYYLSLMPCCN